MGIRAEIVILVDQGLKLLRLEAVGQPVLREALPRVVTQQAPRHIIIQVQHHHSIRPRVLKDIQEELALNRTQIGAAVAAVAQGVWAVQSPLLMVMRAVRAV
jgi:hypothetical protein